MTQIQILFKFFIFSTFFKFKFCSTDLLFDQETVGYTTFVCIDSIAEWVECIRWFLSARCPMECPHTDTHTPEGGYF